MPTHPLMGSIERLHAARARLQGVAAELADIREDPDARHVGSDPEGAVELTIDSRGAPLTVRVSGNWQNSVGPAGLGPAVLAARTAAVAARLEAWSAAADQADERRAAGEVPPVPSAGPGAEFDSGPELSATEVATILPAARAERDRYIAAVQELNAAVDEVHSPFAMMTAANEWNRVLRLVSGQIGELDATLFMGVESWTGRSGYSYRGLPGQQADALSGMTSHLDALSSMMSGHATGIVDEWVKMAKELFDYLLKQIDNVSAFITADPLEWLDIVPKIVAVVTTLLGVLGNIATNLANYATQVVDEISELNRALSNVSGSRSGRWPTLQIEAP